MTYPICERDGFPKVRIKGRMECVAEYLDRYIGGQRIVDMVQHGKIVYLVFENGHELPMLCSCCDGPLEFEDLASSRRDMCGRRLESMAISKAEPSDGSQVEFWLELSGKRLSRGIRLAVSPQVAAQMRHPDSFSTRRPASKKRRRRRPRKR